MVKYLNTITKLESFWITGEHIDPPLVSEMCLLSCLEAFCLNFPPVKRPLMQKERSFSQHAAAWHLPSCTAIDHTCHQPHDWAIFLIQVVAITNILAWPLHVCWIWMLENSQSCGETQIKSFWDYWTALSKGHSCYLKPHFTHRLIHLSNNCWVTKYD